MKEFFKSLLIDWNVSLLLITGFLFPSFSSFSQAPLLDSTYVIQFINSAKSQPDSTLVFEEMESALLIARSINYTTGKAYIVDWLSSYYEMRGDNISALRYYLELLEVQKKQSDNLAAAKTKYKIAGIYDKESLSKKAIEYYTEIESSTDNQIDVWQKMARCFIKESNSASANYYIEKIFNKAKEENDYIGMLSALQEQVNAANQIDVYQQALQHNFEILALITKKKDPSLLAIAYNNLGYNFVKLGSHEKAIEYLSKAENIEEDKTSLDRAVLFTNLGVALQNNGDVENGIAYLRKARQRIDRKNDPERFAYISHLISTTYYQNKDLYNAKLYNEEAIETSKISNDRMGLKDTYNLASSIYQGLYDYEKALTYYKNHLALRDSIVLEERLRQQALLQQQYLMERAEKEIKILITNQEIQDLNMNQLNLEKDKLELSTAALKLEAEKQERELTLLKQEQEIREAAIQNRELQAKQTQQNLLLTTQQLAAAKQEQQISDLNRKEAEQRLALAEKENEEKERIKEISLLSKDKQLLTRQQEIAQLEIDKQSAFRQLASGIGALGLVILGLILAGLVFARRSNKKLSKQNTEIENQKSELEKNRDIIQSEKAKSDELLLNILPAETAKELKEVGVATPLKYELVTVLFTDFSEFTTVSKTLSAEELIHELNECFIAFDEIIDKHGLEKIKTIGDAYMCAGGLPVANTTNPKDVVSAAIEMRNFMNKRFADKQKSNKEYWNMRVGVHSGEVIAGVVGKRKFAYDIWGDTVNIASRMESNGEVGKINVSAETYKYIKDDFSTNYRGSLPIKNGGDVEMYFVDSKPKSA